ncbi:MAG: glycosyl hydrolase family 28-related protein [Desulfotomaculaceae bacterium]|nr:glycosyl hydrolase family 28-related protein [Desulfotomaculaceae bacterium]
MSKVRLSLLAVLLVTIISLPLFAMKSSGCIVREQGAGYKAGSYNITRAAVVSIINVKEFGAKGDGETDDTAALQNAVDSLSPGGGTVVFPPGTYITKDQITVRDKVSLIGSGINVTVIKNINNTHILRLDDGASDLIVRGLTLDGNKGITGYGILAVTANKNITIESCKVCNTGSIGILFSNPGIENIIIRDNILSDIGSSRIEHAGYEGNGLYLGGGAGRIQVYRNSISRVYGHACVFMAGVKDITVSDNHLFDTRYRAIQCFGNGNRNVLIENNNIYNTGAINDSGEALGCNGILIDSSDAPPRSFTIRGNTLANIGENGIECWSGAIIEGNTIDRTGYRSDLAGDSKEGIHICSGSIVKNNTVKNTGTKGIELNAIDAVYKDTVIEENIIANVGIEGKWQVGIRIVADGPQALVDNITIRKNTIGDDQEYPTTMTGINVFRTNGGLLGENIYVQNNYIEGSVKSKLDLDRTVRTR